MAHEALWIGTVVAICVAGASGYAEHRRQRRRDIDRVGLMPWPLIQFLALLAAAIMAGSAVGLI